MSLLRKSFLIITLSFLSFPAMAQLTTYPLVNVGYTYQNQSFGEIGGKLLFVNNDNYIYRIGASALMGEVHSDFAVLPKLQADFLFNTQKNVDLFHSYYFLVSTEATTQYIAPKVGISIFGLLDFTGGYAFSIHKNGINGKKLEGLNIGLSLSLPLGLLTDSLKK